MKAALHLLVPLALTLGACAGGEGSVRFDGLRYPASLSPVLRVREARRPLEQVGRVQVQGRSWASVWRLVSFNPTVDLSHQINAQVEAAHGTGVVNLKVQVTGCGVNAVFLLDWLPIWPSCTLVEITGDIVRET